MEHTFRHHEAFLWSEIDRALFKVDDEPSRIALLFSDRNFQVHRKFTGLNGALRAALFFRKEPSALPVGGRRLLQQLDGYEATHGSGEVTRRGGKATGARPGKLVRGTQGRLH